MALDVIITPASGLVDFQNSGISSATIQLDGSGNLNIASSGGDIQIGDTSSDVYIGDGVNNVDIVFEQSGEIRGLTGKTITLGQSDSFVAFAGTVTGDVTFTGKLVFPDNGTVPDDPTNEQYDYMTFGANGSISQVSGRGALMIASSDDSLILANGDVGRTFTSSNINVDTENIFLLSDSSVTVKTDLQSGFGSENTYTFAGGEISSPRFTSTQATGTAPFTVSSTTVVSNLNADLLDGSQKDTLVASLRANHNITGGGTITFNSSGYLINSQRFIVISNGRGSHFSTSGYFDINIPTSGTITGVGGASNKTATSNGIPLDSWEALYYILPIGSANNSVAANFRVCDYTSGTEIPETWVLLAIRNGDSGQKCWVIGKYGLELGESIDTTTYDAKNADLLDELEASQFLRSDADDTTTGQIQITKANNTATGGGQLYLNGATGNRIDFNTNGVAAPAFTTRSAGTKLVLYPTVNSTQVDYGLGIDSGTLWYSIPLALNTRQHRWYGGETQLVDLKGSGELVIGSTSLTGTANQKLQVSGGAYVSGDVGIGITNPSNTLTINGANNDTTPILGLRSGNVNFGFNDGAQIAFGYDGTDDYQHFIQTRHNSGNSNNAIDFYVCDGTQNNTLTSGSIHTMSLVSGSVGINSTAPTARLDVNGDVSIASTVSIGTTIDIVPYNDLGALSFEGSAGQLFSITNNLTSGSIFSVNDVSGIPSIDVDADGTVLIAPYGSTEYVGIGTTNPTAKLDVDGTLNVSGVSTFQDSVFLGDDDRLYFGAGSDLQIFHNSSNNNSIINETGPGNLIIGADNNVEIRNTAATEYKAKFITNGAVELYYDNSKKFETTGYGVTVSGGVYVSGISTFQGNVNLGDNDKAIFGDGGDLEIYHNGNDSIIKESGSGSFYLNATNIVFRNSLDTETLAQFNTNGAVSLYYDNDKKFETTADGVTVTGNVTADGLRLGDSEYAYFGDSNDLQIYHDGLNSTITDTGTGKLLIYGNDAIFFQSYGSGDYFAKFNSDAAVELYYDNFKKFETTTNGIIVTGSIDLTSELNFTGPANKYVDFYTKDSGGTAYSATLRLANHDSTSFNFAINMIRDGAVELYHSGIKKFETTGYGVTVSGGVYVSGISTFQGGIHDGTSLGTSGQVLSSTGTGLSWIDAAAGGGGGSGTFDTGITTSIYVSVTSGVGANTAETNDIFVGPSIAYTFPSTSGKKYVIESIHITNTFANELYFVGRHDFNGGSNVPLAQRVIVPYQGATEFLDQPIIANPSDILRFQALTGTGSTATGIDGGLDAFITYSTKDDTDYIGTGKTVTTAAGTEIFQATSNPAMLQSIKLCNYSLNSDIDASISIYNGGLSSGVRQGYLAYNLTIPKNSVIEILEKPKYLATNAAIVGGASAANVLGVTLSGKYIT